LCFHSIPESGLDWTVIYFASILEIQLFLQFLLSEVVAPLTPVSITPVCVSGPRRLVISLGLYLMYPYFYICIPESGLTSLQDTATPVTIDNDASLQQTTNDKNSKPGR
jgi:hypothetical protein